MSPAGTRKPLQETTSVAASDASSTTNEIDNLLKDFDLPSSVSSGKGTCEIRLFQEILHTRVTKCMCK